MAALTANFLNTKSEPAQVLPNLYPGALPVAANVKLFANALVALNASGYVVPASANASLLVLGRIVNSVDNTGGAAGAANVIVEQGAFDYDIASGVNAVTIADVGKLVFAQDDHTVSRTDQTGTLPVLGVLLNLYTPANSSTTRAIVQVGPSTGNALHSASNAFKARAVVTSLAAFASANGTLTGSVNGAIGAQDGVTLAVGDVVLLPKVVAGGATVAAAEVGPYVVVSLGGASSKYVLSRPSWFASGSAIPQGVPIFVSGEGTVWSGTDWRCMSAAGAVDVADPKMYPRIVKGTVALVAGAATVSSLFVWTAAQACANDATADKAVKITLTAGNGSGSIAFVGTTTDTVVYVISNF